MLSALLLQQKYTLLIWSCCMPPLKVEDDRCVDCPKSVIQKHQFIEETNTNNLWINDYGGILNSFEEKLTVPKIVSGRIDSSTLISRYQLNVNCCRHFVGPGPKNIISFFNGAIKFSTRYMKCKQPDLLHHFYRSPDPLNFAKMDMDVPKSSYYIAYVDPRSATLSER